MKPYSHAALLETIEVFDLCLKSFAAIRELISKVGAAKMAAMEVSGDDECRAHVALLFSGDVDLYRCFVLTSLVETRAGDDLSAAHFERAFALIDEAGERFVSRLQKLGWSTGDKIEILSKRIVRDGPGDISWLSPESSERAPGLLIVRLWNNCASYRGKSIFIEETIQRGIDYVRSLSDEEFSRYLSVLPPAEAEFAFAQRVKFQAEQLGAPFSKAPSGKN